MAEIVITAVGPDRPGLVDEISSYLLAAGGNIADSRMANLRGQFAVVLLVEAPELASSAIRQGVVEAGKKIGLTVAVAPQGAPPVPVGPGLPYRIKVHAMDQPGIVHRITHILHHRGVNIEELQTRLEAGSYTGTPLFNMEMRLSVPANVPVDQLRHELEELCDSLNCDLDMQTG